MVFGREEGMFGFRARLGFGVCRGKGLGVGVDVVGCMVQGLGCIVQDLGIRVRHSGLRFEGVWFEVYGSVRGCKV